MSALLLALLLADTAEPGELVACQQKLAHLRQQQAAIEPVFVSSARPQALFDTGAPNPTAERTLRPLLGRFFQNDAGAADYLVECKTWICRVRVVERDGAHGPWMHELQRDREILARTVGRGFESGRPTRDPLSHTGLSEQFVYL